MPYLSVGSMRLLNIRVERDGEVLYEGMSEDAPDEIKKLKYNKITGGTTVVLEV